MGGAGSGFHELLDALSGAAKRAGVSCLIGPSAERHG
jgi:hypothetical protein